MPTEPDLYYLYHPVEEPQTAGLHIKFLPVSEFLLDEPACKLLWELVSTQFRTRGKFLAVWSGVRFVYVVVRPDARGKGIAAAMVKETLPQAFLHRVPYVMLTSKPGLRSLYESCGLTVVGSSEDHRYVMRE
jgi:GNAT superfamily N-acetyltransferase